MSRDDLIRVVNRLFEDQNIVFENAQVIWRALADYRNAKPVKVGGRNKLVDFPDALIVNKAREQTTSFGSEFQGVATFDKAAQSIEGTFQP